VVGGLITSVREHVDRKGKKMAFVKMEDETGEGEITFFSADYDPGVVATGKVILVRVKVSSRSGRIQMSAADVRPIESQGQEVNRLNLRFSASEDAPEVLAKVKDLLVARPGQTPVFLHVRLNGEESVLEADRPFRIKPTKDLLGDLRGLLGPERVWLS
jgi:DNA polymerase-3 subunit alpha